MSSLAEERLRKLSRSSISDVSEHLINPGPHLLKRIINQDSDSCKNEALTERNGVLHFTNGNTYTGNIKDGMLVGSGTFVWRNGTIYTGEFDHGQITGRGEYKWNDRSRYVGEVFNGLRHGNGILYNSNGHCIYNGEWCNGKKHGKGKMIFNGNDNSFYEGEWSNDQQNGYGIRKYESGNFYEGNWKNSCRHGNGTMHWIKRGETYNGEWKDGVQNGKGEHIWHMNQTDNSQYPVCNRYNGEWVNGKKHGQGVFYYASGGCYKGTWSLNMKHGKGQYVLPNGQVTEGVYKEDRRVTNDIGRIANIVVNTARPITPLGSLIGDIDGSNTIGSTTQQFNMGVSSLVSLSCDVTSELRKVHCVILRYLTQLKRCYHYYSTLVIGITDDTRTGSKVLKRIQLWQLLSDCRLYRHCITIAEANTIIQRAIGDKSDDCYCNNLLTPFLMREFLQCIVFIGYRAYSHLNPSLEWCLDQFIGNDFIPNVCMVKGIAFQYCPIVSTYTDNAVRLYTEMSNSCSTQPTLRDYILFLNNRHIIGISDSLGVKQIVSKLVELHPLAQDGEDYNLNNPMTFLEFYNMMIVCSLLHYKGCQEKEKSVKTDENHDNEHLLQNGNRSSETNNSVEQEDNIERRASGETDKKVTFEDQVIEEEERVAPNKPSITSTSAVDSEKNIAKAIKEYFVLFETERHYD